MATELYDLTTMALSPLAGKPAPASLLINVDQLLAAYHELARI